MGKPSVGCILASILTFNQRNTYHGSQIIKDGQNDAPRYKQTNPVHQHDFVNYIDLVFHWVRLTTLGPKVLFFLRRLIREVQLLKVI